MIVALVTAAGKQNRQPWQPTRRFTIRLYRVERYAPIVPREHYQDVLVCTWAYLSVYCGRWFFSIGPAWHWEIL